MTKGRAKQVNDLDKSPEELVRELELLRSIVAEFERVEEQRQKAEDYRQTMLEISEAVHNTNNLDELYHSIHTSLSRVIYAKNFYIALYYEETKLFSFPYAVDEMEDVYDPQPHDLSNSMTAYVLNNGKPILADDAQVNALADQGEITIIGSPSASWIGVPLTTREKVIGVMVVQSYSEDVLYSESDLEVMSFISEQIATAIERKRSEEELAAAYARIRHDLEMASRVQHSMLPTEAPRTDNYEFAWVFNPCEAIAGDMFNVFMLDEKHVGIYVLDVSGHGMQAALLSVTLNHILTPMHFGSGILCEERAAKDGHDIVSPALVASKLNHQFPISLETNQFFTMLYGVLELETGRFEYVRAGHTPPMIVEGKTAQYTECESCPSIGIMAGVKYKTEELMLKPGQFLILHTDGVDEAANMRMEEFGTEGLEKALTKKANQESVEDLVEAVQSAVKLHTRGLRQSDDITIFGVHRRG